MESTRKEFTRITVGVNGRRRKQRSWRYILLTVDDLEGRGTITPEQFVELERKAWQMIDDEGITPDTRRPNDVALLGAHDAELLYMDSPNPIERVNMLPHQKQIIMRNRGIGND
jgi:hypothetical protein